MASVGGWARALGTSRQLWCVIAWANHRWRLKVLERPFALQLLTGWYLLLQPLRVLPETRTHVALMYVALRMLPETRIHVAFRSALAMSPWLQLGETLLQCGSMVTARAQCSSLTIYHSMCFVAGVNGSTSRAPVYGLRLFFAVTCSLHCACQLCSSAHFSKRVQALLSNGVVDSNLLCWAAGPVERLPRKAF